MTWIDRDDKHIVLINQFRTRVLQDLAVRTVFDQEVPQSASVDRKPAYASNRKTGPCKSGSDGREGARSVLEPHRDVFQAVSPSHTQSQAPMTP